MSGKDREREAQEAEDARDAAMLYTSAAYAYWREEKYDDEERCNARANEFFDGLAQLAEEAGIPLNELWEDDEDSYEVTWEVVK